MAGGFDNRAVKVDRILTRTFAVIRRDWQAVLGTSFVLAGLPSIAINLFSTRLNAVQPGDPAAALGAAVSTMISGLVAALFYILLQAVLVPMVLAFDGGRRADLGGSLAAGLRTALPLLVLNILLGIALFFGLLLLLVPGVMLAVLWAVANPALVAERIGIGAAFSRSAALTRGARWKVFGVELVAIVFIWLASTALAILLVAVDGVGSLGTAAVRQPAWYVAAGAVVQTLVAAFWAVVQASLYVELRDWKDGPRGAALADVFS